MTKIQCEWKAKKKKPFKICISMDHVTDITDERLCRCLNESQHSHDPINLNQNDNGHMPAHWHQ